MRRSWLNAQPVPMQGRPSCNSSLGILSDTVFSGDRAALDDKPSEEPGVSFCHPFADKSSFSTAEEASEESLEGQPWKQDVTRPSWLPNAQERVSISSYFKARSAPIEGLPSNAVAAPAAAEPGFETFTAQSLEEMAVQELGLGTPRVAVPDGSVQGPSTSAIYHVLEDISISESPSAMVRKFIHATRSQKPPPRADLQERNEFSGDATFKQPLTAAPRSKKAAASRDGRAEAEEAPSEPASARQGLAACGPCALRSADGLCRTDPSTSKVWRRMRRRWQTHRRMRSSRRRGRFKGGGLVELGAVRRRRRQRPLLGAFIWLLRASDAIRFQEVPGVPATA
ncbi:hypothetical protein IscW_ISCW002809 [Ixodes scapularis]|uniref:Uncharacterized protein n=1 Tax=Ixodes scapularis TaxID=6945 RepID=B7PCM3_IXOSC|nr:hypothetical protein IscW_ISCW002809 [Ixodes scapularis]|eukprot:XP_002410017.1 hypothetical protein IscW_ISCW002809 [Ixodes scapularis]